MAEHIKSIHDEHEEQFNIAVNAAFQRGFGRWFDDTWFAARSAGALPNPFISSMFVFITTILTKKFIAGLPATLSVADKEQAIMQASGFLKGYLDQIEAAAIKELHNPKPSPTEEAPLTSGGKPAPKQSIILPKKRKFHS